MVDLIEFIRAYPDIRLYFPADEELVKCGKEWITNMLQTLQPAEFTEFVKQQERIRRDKIDSQRKLQVNSNNLINDLDSNCQFFCSKVVRNNVSLNLERKSTPGCQGRNQEEAQQEAIRGS